MTSQAMTVKPGLYEHYKGQHYRVIGTARHSETEELLVVYTALYQKPANYDDPTDLGNLWVRPAKMFTETVSILGRNRPRFQRIAD